jgi:uncharacterized membrane protein YhaH (DUF805 family)
MRAAYQVIIALGIGCLLSTLCMFSDPRWYCILLAALTFLSLIATLIITGVIGFRRWRQTSQFWMLPSLACFIFLVAAWYAPFAGRLISDWRFGTRLSEFTVVVDEIRNDPSAAAALDHSRLSIIQPKNLPDRVRVIKAAGCGDGSVVVAFVMTSDVPLVHEGYVFKGYDENNPCIKERMRPEENWPYLRYIRGNWYHFSDQPGL